MPGGHPFFIQNAAVAPRVNSIARISGAVYELLGCRIKYELRYGCNTTSCTFKSPRSQRPPPFKLTVLPKDQHGAVQVLTHEVVSRFVPKREASSWVRVRIYARRIAVHIEANVLVGMAPMTRRFVAAMERFALEEGIDLITFERGERKDDRAQRYLKACSANEGVLFIGKAQEKARIVRTQRRHDPQTERITPGSSLPQPWSTTTTSSRIGCHSANSCRQ